MIGQSIWHWARLAYREPRIVLGTITYRACLRTVRGVLRRPVILFERHAGIGDIICSFPAVLALRERHPNALFVYSVRKAFKEIVKMGRVADYVVEEDWSREIPKVLHRDYDASYQPWLEDEQSRGRPHAHLVDDFAQTLDVTLTSRQPRLHVPFLASASIGKRISALRPQTRYLFGIQVGPSWRVREWTTEAWTQLVILLREKYDCTIIQLGSDQDTGKGFVRAERIPGAEDWVGELSLEETVAALARLSVFIGIDSGLLHAAGAVGTPTVGVFGPIDPLLRLPPSTPSVGVTSDVYCLGCHHRLPRMHWQEGCPEQIQCMKLLSVRRVLEAISSLIEKQ